MERPSGAQGRRRQKAPPSGGASNPVILRIGFTGLCLFAKPKHDNRMYVLMPDVAEVPNMPLHFPEFSAQGVGSVNLEGEIDLTHLPVGNPTLEEYLPGVGDVSPYSEGGVRSRLLSGPLPDSLSVRIILPAGCVVAYNPGAHWQTLCGQPFGQYLASFVVWGIHITRNITVGDLTGSSDTRPLPPTNNRVNVHMTNLPARDPSAMHFAGYGAIVQGFNCYPEGGRGTDQDLVTGPGTSLPGADQPKFPAHHRHMEADFMTCMVAQAKVI